MRLLTVTVPLSSVVPAPEAGAASWSIAELTQEVRKNVRQELEAKAAEQGYANSDLVVTCGDPRDEILRAAKAMDADLIVMGTNNRGLLNRLLLGTTTHGVLNLAPCSVLVLSTPETKN